MVELNLTNLVKEGPGLKTGIADEIIIKVSGHAGFEKKNRDIVCAAISAIIQTAIVSITKVSGIHQNIEQSQGYLKSIIKIISLTDIQLHDLMTILNTMITGLQEIISQYPEAIMINYEKN